MKIKTFAALVAWCVAGAASAATFNGGVAAGPFSVDVATFSFTSGQKATVSFGVGSSAVDINVPVAPGLTVPVHYNALTFSGVTLQSLTDPTISLTDPDLSNGALFTVLAPGNYAIRLTGSSATGGVYAGSYDVAVASVAEPETLGLALAGLAVLGWAGRPRKS